MSTFKIEGQSFGRLVITAITFVVPFLVTRDLALHWVLGWDFAVRHIESINPRTNVVQVHATPPPGLDSWAREGPRPAPTAPVLAALNALCTRLRHISSPRSTWQPWRPGSS
jgi:hypothetical protein